MLPKLSTVNIYDNMVQRPNVLGEYVSQVDLAKRNFGVEELYKASEMPLESVATFNSDTVENIRIDILHRISTQTASSVNS